MTQPRLLLLAPSTTYRVESFLDAARRLDVAVRIASDRCHMLAEHWGVPLALDFRDPEAAARTVLAHAAGERLDGIVATDDASTVIAGLVASALGLPATSAEAAYAARNKRVLRERLAAAGVRAPAFRVLEAYAAEVALREAGAAIGYPVVVKPLLMSGSRGVIRADDGDALVAAVRRVAAILRAPDVKPSDDADSRRLIVEAFVPGAEVALEGMLVGGRLRVLALFDKPDPLDGPYFEETIYVTPSRVGAEVARQVAAETERAASSIGLTRGPVHAELRLGAAGPVVLEVAGRSIGGLCSRALRFGAGRSLEELVILDALGRDLPDDPREALASGVMMIPIPSRGLLRQVRGLEAAAAVPGIDGVEITARLGHEILPLPEGASYLGFLFARAATPAEVERALRAANACLAFVITPNLVMGR